MRRIARDNRAAERVRGRTATSVRVRLRALLARLDERPSAEINTVSRKSYRELFHFSKGVLKGMKGVCITLESDSRCSRFECTAATSARVLRRLSGDGELTLAIEEKWSHPSRLKWMETAEGGVASSIGSNSW